MTLKWGSYASTKASIAFSYMNWNVSLFPCQDTLLRFTKATISPRVLLFLIQYTVTNWWWSVIPEDYGPGFSKTNCTCSSVLKMKNPRIVVEQSCPRKNQESALTWSTSPTKSWSKEGKWHIPIQKCNVLWWEFTYPFTSIIPCAGQHLLKGSDRQGLFKNKITDAKVWRNIL